MLTCHICRQPWTSHAPDCRVPADLARMRKVAERLEAEGRDDPLLHKLRTYLGLFGQLPCQGRAAMPDAHDCASCGHKEVCVILPDAA